MSKVVVEVADGFSAFGKDYAIGDILSDSEFSNWPDGTVEKRLENGFLKHKVISDTPDAPSGDTGEQNTDRDPEV